MGRLRNTQMFALPDTPPVTLEVAGGHYALARVFKHDFWAATCLYQQTDQAGEFPQIVVKFGRSQGFVGIPLRWTGVGLAGHEQAIYERLAGVAGIPRWVGRIDEITYAIEYIDATPLDHFAPEALPAGLFERIRTVFDAIHARGVAYVDSNKRSNILVDAEGEVTVIDFQISLAEPLDWPGPLLSLAQRVIRYFQGKDLYHLYKHKRRLAKHDLTPEEDALSRHRSWLHRLHRKASKPYRSFRRGLLQRQHQRGDLVSPTADLEDHHQPEKETWRQETE